MFPGSKNFSAQLECSSTACTNPIQVFLSQPFFGGPSSQDLFHCRLRRAWGLLHAPYAWRALDPPPPEEQGPIRISILLPSGPDFLCVEWTFFSSTKYHFPRSFARDCLHSWNVGILEGLCVLNRKAETELDSSALHQRGRSATVTPNH